MNLFRKSMLPAALCLTLVANGRGAEDDKKPEAGDKDAGKTVTVRGVISGFTMVGETAVDQATGKVVTAEATLVTVIGHPAMQLAEYRERAEAAQAKGEGAAHAEHHHHRMNLYVAALTPKTKVTELMASGKEVAIDDKDADYDDLEIGDRVELTFAMADMDKDQDKAKADAKPAADDKPKDEGKKATAKHGRHRSYLGTAVQIKLMAEHMEGPHHDGNSEHKPAQ